MPRQLRGTLQDLHTTQILHLINLAKKTGTLKLFEGLPTGKEIIMGDGETRRPEVTPGKERARVAFRDGKLIHAVRADQDSHLATVLHKSGKLNDEQHRVIREKAAKANDKALALLLINANYVTQVDVVQSVRQQTLEIVYDLGTWNKEPFIFEEGEQPTTDRITVPIELENVILEISRKAFETETVNNVVQNLDFALKFAESPGELRNKQLQLSVEEWRVVSFINPKNTIRQIAKACNMTDTEIKRIVYGLMNAGMVELIKPAEPPKPNAGRSTSRQINPSTPQRPVITKLIERIKNL
jgi:hypothetical protein